MVRPVLGVLPMGWAHALALCQQIHLSAIEEEEDISAASALSDTRPPKPLGPGAHTEYVDNFIAFSTAQGVGADLTSRAASAITR